MLALFLQSSGHTMKHSYTDMYCPEELTCWMKVVPVCWTKHDVMKYRGLVLISSFSVFLPGRWACVVNFYKVKKERARKNRGCSYAFSNASII